MAWTKWIISFSKINQLEIVLEENLTWVSYRHTSSILDRSTSAHFPRIMSYVLFLPFMPGSMTNMNKLLSPSSSDTLSAKHHSTSPICALFLRPPPTDSLSLPRPEGHINTTFLSFLLGVIYVLHLQTLFLRILFFTSCSESPHFGTHPSMFSVCRLEAEMICPVLTLKVISPGCSEHQGFLDKVFQKQSGREASGLHQQCHFQSHKHFLVYYSVIKPNSVSFKHLSLSRT